MDKQIVRLFEDYDAAQRAREELLAAGFGDADVQLKATEDEAGPGQSNFTVGNDPAVVGGDTYEKTFAPKKEIGHFIMVVNVADTSQAKRASEILALYGATSGDPAQQPPDGA
jgi:hypothetical protein